jgi:hypothetical protein
MNPTDLVLLLLLIFAMALAGIAKAHHYTGRRLGLPIAAWIILLAMAVFPSHL